jgi:hypothetical protein
MKKVAAGFGAVAIAVLAPTMASAQNAPALQLYADTGFRGEMHRVDRGVENLGAVRFADRARSMIADGRWEVCLDAGYQGGCRVVQGRVSDMGDWNQRVSSVRYLGPADWGSASGAESGARPMAAGGAAAPATTPPPTRPVYRLDWQPEVIGRSYETDFGQLTLERWDRAGAAGRYAGTATDNSDAGRIEGIVKPDQSDGGATLAGQWYAGYAVRRCETERGGTYYWGAVTLIFNRDRTAFQGFWDHCGGGGAAEGSWHGKLIGRDPVIAAAVNAQLAGQPGAPAQAAAKPGASGVSPSIPVDAKGQPLPGFVDRAARTAGDEIERRVQDKIREGIGKVF